MTNLVKCKTCGHEVAKNAKSCPSCGVSTPGISTKDKAVSWLVIGLLVAGAWIWLSGSDSKPKEKTDAEKWADTRRSVEYACQQYIKRKLHDPEGATFETGLSVYEKEGIHYATIPTLAKNGFNATRRAEFKCALKLVDDSWLLVSLEP